MGRELWLDLMAVAQSTESTEDKKISSAIAAHLSPRCTFGRVHYCRSFRFVIDFSSILYLSFLFPSYPDPGGAEYTLIIGGMLRAAAAAAS